MMHPKFSSAIITCEHAGNDVPNEYQLIFKDANEVLQSHRGWDPGAIEIARWLALKNNLSLFQCDVTRLLIEANRSIDHPELFSVFSKSLPENVKEEIKQRYYFPYRNTVESKIQSTSIPVLHLSIHTFTPFFNTETRSTDIGLLFDPSRKLESMCCTHLRARLSMLLPSFQIDFNQPYAGTDDGFTTYLRTKFLDENYAGIEIEVNQKYHSNNDRMKISMALNDALAEILN
jgi:predicted N-formylglutamate amidohydrolase